MRLTVAELAAFLGISTSGVRQVIRRQQVKPSGKGHFGAKLYDPREVLRHTGSHDRLSV